MITEAQTSPEQWEMNFLPGQVLVVDIDSTIWDAWPWYVEAAKSIAGVDLVYEDADTYEYFFEMMGEDQVHAMFDEVLSPSRVMRRTWYTNCQEVLRMCVRELMMDLHFVSHNDKPRALYPAVQNWLRRSLGVENFKLAIGPEDELDKAVYAVACDATVCIDDKPSTLIDAYWQLAPKSLIATKMHPWNRELSEIHGGVVRGFDTWLQAAGMISKHVRGGEDAV